jgi:hypothetical protein
MIIKMGNPTPVNDDILDAMRVYVAEASGIPLTAVIPGDDNHPAPNGLYATVLDITTLTRGIDSEVKRESATPNKVTMLSRGNRTMTFSVQFFRNGAQDAAANFKSFPSTSASQLFYTAENPKLLTFSRAGEVRNTDVDRGSKFERRRTIDVDMYYTSVREDEVNEIGSVEIDINITANSGTDINESLEVTP